MMNSHLDKGLKAIYAIAVAAVLIAALRPQPLKPAQSQQPASTTPQQPIIQPAPVAQLPPSPSSEQLPEVYDPELRSWIEAVQTWDAATIDQWWQHCAYFNGGQGLPEPDNLICKALELRQ